MGVRSTSAAILALALVGTACARNKTSEEVGAARDTTAAARADTTRDQTQSGVTDTSGQSTLGKGVERTRPDQGQPVTSKGDTLNKGVDSAAVQQRTDTSSMQRTDTSSMPRTDTSTAHRTDSSTTQPTDTSTMQKVDSSSLRTMDTTSTPR